ncbi:MAG TPA: LPS export ABC transporter periplasmic protein LptC [Candidatus Baltobacteraceae bacterium]|jgi:lipopolysaccharide assembly outer membrane protein LptD (OstA)
MNVLKPLAFAAALAFATPASFAAAKAPSPAPVAAPIGSKAAGFTFGDWQVHTDEFDYNWQNGDFSTPGHLTLTRPGSDISAEKASGNQKSKQATLVGGVVLHDRAGMLTGATGGPAAGPHEPATLTCDRLQVDGVSKVYTAIGNVHFVQGARRMNADRATMNGLTHQLRLFGRVVLAQ